jgi:hypothetical protein
LAAGEEALDFALDFFFFAGDLSLFTFMEEVRG